MAEFCLDCLNKQMGTTDRPKMYVMSRKAELCEGCGKWKRVVVRYKIRYILAERVSELAEAFHRRRKQR